MKVRMILAVTAVALSLVACCKPMEPAKPAGSPQPNIRQTGSSAAVTPVPAPAAATGGMYGSTGTAAPVAPVAAVQNGFTLVDNFDSYAVGTDILGKNAWATGSNKPATGVFTVQTDPANPANKALRIDKLGDESRFRAVNTSSAIVIPAKATATVFLRVRTEGDKAVDISFGHGDKQAEAPGRKPAYADHRIQYVLHAKNQEVRGGSDGEPVEGLAASELVPATWYSLWFVVNNTARTYDVYIQGGAYKTQTKVASDVKFRAASEIKADQPLDRFFVTVDDESTGTAYVDDLCVDQKANLASAVK